MTSWEAFREPIARAIHDKRWGSDCGSVWPDCSGDYFDLADAVIAVLPDLAEREAKARQEGAAEGLADLHREARIYYYSQQSQERNADIDAADEDD